MTPRRISAALWASVPLVVVLTASLPWAPATAGTITEARVSLDSAIFVEHVEHQNGTAIHSLEPAKHLLPGERVVTLVNWQRAPGSASGTGGFVLVNALPARLNYQRSSQADEEVSVDGGRSWGRLGALRIEGRAATAADVTHIRWHVSPEQASVGSGQIAYAGVVR